ncbi:HAD family hydrolase [Candidatus Neomarinimicrobiota bacterium]
MSDMDGVVIDSEPLYQKAEVEFFATYGVTVLPEHWNVFRGSTEEKFYEIAREMYGIDDPLDQLLPKGREYVLRIFEQELGYNDGFLELISRINGRYKTALVTSTPGAIYNWIDDRLGMGEHFDRVIFGEMTSNHKPHPEPYTTMFEQLGVLPAEAIVIEDSIHGLNSALASKAWTVALTGSIPVEDMPRAHALIESLNEIDDQFIETIQTRKNEEPVS